MEAVPPLAVMELLKAAYGLSEAPRAWYLEAVRLLEQQGWRELGEAKATFVHGPVNSKTQAILNLHVDDGLLGGDHESEYVQEVVNNIQKNFNIKAWNVVDHKGIDFLGAQIRKDKEAYILEMNAYVLNKLEGLTVGKKDPEERQLNAKEKNAFRSTLQKAAWPSRRVSLATQYKVSNLASRVNEATVKDQKMLNQVVTELREMAEQQELRVIYKPVDEATSCMVTAHDASFACEEGGKSQAGFVTGLSDNRIQQGSAPFNMLEYSSHRIKRTVRSTMSAESCALAEALDAHLYTRVLYQAMVHTSWQTSRQWQEDLMHKPQKGFLLTDGKSLHDHLNSTAANPSEKQVMLDLMFVREEVERGLVQVRWIPGSHMLADPLTKWMKPSLVVQQLQRDGTYSLVQEEAEAVEEARKAVLRRDQRLRHRAKLKGELAEQQKTQ
eukprot:6472029-Amphidinium_carterae.1